MSPLPKRYRTVPCCATSSISLTGLRVVFHHECYGISKAEVTRAPMMACRQHSCSLCFRNTGDAGGMLFRCVLSLVVAFCSLVLIRAGVEHVHKPSVKTAYRKTTLTLSETPYQNCSSLLNSNHESLLFWTNQWSFPQLAPWIRCNPQRLLHSLS